MLNTMIDIETYGLSPDAPIASIGAVTFEFKDNFSIIDTFYRNVDQDSNILINRKYDQSVVDWWNSQSLEVKNTLYDNQVPVKQILIELFDWLPKSLIWCQGLDFDIPIIKSSAEASGLSIPWKYNNVRCGRTLLRLTGIRVKNATMKHNALIDAIEQAEALNKSFLLLKEKGLIIC